MATTTLKKRFLNKPSNGNYAFQVIVILSIFFFVLFNLVFQLMADLKRDALEKEAREAEKQRIQQEFITNIEDQYNQLIKMYKAKEYSKAIEIIKVFNRYEKPDYKQLTEIKKDIRLFYLNKKLDFIPDIQFEDYLKLSRDIDIKGDDSTEVFIRTPRYNQYFYVSDLPVVLEGVALSIVGDFSENIIWTSSKDGYLGEGYKITTPLSVGEHTITATCTNGITAGKMITHVVVEQDPAFLKTYRR